MNDLLPIIIIALIPICLTIYLVKVLGSKKNKHAIVAKSQWLLAGYVLILLISVVVFFFIPIEAESNNESSIQVDDIPDLFIMFGEGEVSNIDRKFIEKEWEFTIEGDQLELTTSGSENTQPIYIDRTNEMGNTIHVVHYRTPTIITGNIDVTKFFPPVHAELRTDNLNIVLPEEISLNCAGYKQEFPFTQFSKGKMDTTDWMDGPFLNRGQQYVYIRIPANIKVNFSPDLWINDVGD